MHLSESPTHWFYIRQDFNCYFPAFNKIHFAQCAKIWQNSYYSMVCQKAQCVVNFHNLLNDAISQLLFKWFYHPFFLVSNQSSDDDDLLKWWSFFDEILFAQWAKIWQNSHYSFPWKMELIFKWFYHSSFLVSN